jgi:hypothetical protein
VRRAEGEVRGARALEVPPRLRARWAEWGNAIPVCIITPGDHHVTEVAEDGREREEREGEEGSADEDRAMLTWRRDDADGLMERIID